MKRPCALARLIADVPAAALRAAARAGQMECRSSPGPSRRGRTLQQLAIPPDAENPGVALASFDQEEWAHRGGYESWDPQEAIQMFRLLREANLRLLAELTPEEWQRWGTHSERGHMTVADLARHMPEHDAAHIEQIKRILHQSSAAEGQ